MASVIDLDVQIPIASPTSGTPSENFEVRWHELVVKMQELEQRIYDLENP